MLVGHANGGQMSYGLIARRPHKGLVFITSREEFCLQMRSSSRRNSDHLRPRFQYPATAVISLFDN